MNRHLKILFLSVSIMLLIVGCTKQEKQTATPTTEQEAVIEYVHPEALASTEWLAIHLSDPSVRVIDALPEEYYTGTAYLIKTHRTGHIPTAHNLAAPLFVNHRGELFPPSCIAQRVQKLCLRPDHQIITYCGAGYYGAFDLFVLYLLGYDQVSLYDGSWIEWGANSELLVETDRTGTLRSWLPEVEKYS